MPSPSGGLQVVFTGGGTGGHLYPAIAVADRLRALYGARITFVGTAGRLEDSVVPKAGYPLHTVSSRPLSRDLAGRARALLANAAGTLQSLALLRRLRPDLVIATGGYVCFPVVLAARTLRALRFARAPIALLEPNVRPGLTNRMLAPLVDEVWGAYADGAAHFAGKYVTTGVPVRAGLREPPPREAAIARFGLDPARKTLLAIGGSQGAAAINDASIALLRDARLPEGWQLLAVTGERDYERVRAAAAGASVVAYLDDVALGYAAADLVLARAGASTLAELAATGKPALLVPYPFAADDHQSANARRFAAAGSALVIENRDLEAGALPPLLAQAAAPPRLDAMRAAAARLQAADALATIIARVDRLMGRKREP
jgi:UDP-N-acetylglucosamine--N-acetylmuramyl-(pentapeptide) pyrophosphoryl-undecaprenol N-acetylglucosamine transferase